MFCEMNICTLYVANNDIIASKSFLFIAHINLSSIVFFISIFCNEIIIIAAEVSGSNQKSLQVVQEYVLLGNELGPFNRIFLL